VRRFILLALFVLASSWWGAAMLRRLAVARAGMVAARPVAGDGGDATAALRAAAGAHGLVISRMQVTGRSGGLARTEFAMAGAEPALRAAITDLEGGRPAVRFPSWRMQAVAGSASRLRFEGVALVAPR